MQIPIFFTTVASNPFQLELMWIPPGTSVSLCLRARKKDAGRKGLFNSGLAKSTGPEQQDFKKTE